MATNQLWWTIVPARCLHPCPHCGRGCLGGPARYPERHMCAELHQWGGQRRD